MKISHLHILVCNGLNGALNNAVQRCCSPMVLSSFSHYFYFFCGNHTHPFCSFSCFRHKVCRMLLGWHWCVCTVLHSLTCTAAQIDLVPSNSFLFLHSLPAIPWDLGWERRATPLGKLRSIATCFSLQVYLNELGAEPLLLTFYQYCLY